MNIFDYLVKNRPNATLQAVTYSDGISISFESFVSNTLKFCSFIKSKLPSDRMRVAYIGNVNELQPVVFWGLWRSGHLVYPIDKSQPKKNISYQLDLFKPDLILIDSSLTEQESLREIIPLKISTVISPDDFIEHAEIGEPSKNDKNLPALCVYTSGSTGTPKGVTLTHENLLAGAKNLIEVKKIDPSFKAICVLPLTHINGIVTTLLSPFISGGSVHYYQGPFEARRMAREVQEFKCNWLSAIPFHYNQIYVNRSTDLKSKLSQLNFCRSASAPLTKALIEDFESYFDLPIIETMGMTETAGQIFSNPLPPKARKPGSVGKPIGFDIKIVDSSGKPVKSEEIGELLVSGEGVMAGYLDAPEETDETLKDGWLKSGDLATVDKDGFVTLRGRIKDIAIFSGENISLAALEKSIKESRLAEDVACKTIPHPSFGELIDVFVCGITRPHSKDFKTFGALLKKQLSEFLPSLAAINKIYLVEKLPRSAVGKILKGSINPPLAINEYPTSTGETDAVSVVSKVLSIDRSKLTEKLGIGGHPHWDSLGQVKLVVEIEDILGRGLNRAELFSVSSIPGIEAVMRGETIDYDIDLEAQNVNQILSEFKEQGLFKYKVNYVILSFDAFVGLGVKDVDMIVEKLIESLPDDQVLVMNAFTFQFCETGIFNKNTTQSQMGLINEVFRKKPGVIRTEHPIYSYLVYSKSKTVSDNSFSHESETCWGNRSTTSKLMKRDDVFVISFGLDGLQGNPSLHSLEEKFRVPYRYLKEFNGQMVELGKSKEITTSMFVRDLELDAKNDWEPVIQKMSMMNQIYIDKDRKLVAYLNKDLRNAAESILQKNKLALASIKSKSNISSQDRDSI